VKIHTTVLLVLVIALFPGCTTKTTESAVVSVPVEKEELVDFCSYWEGSLAINPTDSLAMGFTITSGGEGVYEALLQIPSQGLRNFKVSSIHQEHNQLSIGMEQLQATFTGTYDDVTQQIAGTFVQMGQSFPLVLDKGEVKENARPQDPIKPYPYIAEDIYFKQQPEGFKLAGTITRPQGDGPFPAVVLVTGSGSQNRDEELLGHRPFLVLADALTRSGIVVLRYDDRGFAESEGDASAATSLDFANDAESAVHYLKSLPYVDAGNIGILGHSEGGIIAPIVAQRNRDLAFLVLMAGSGVDGVAVLEDQTAAILRAQQAPEPYIAQTVQTNLDIYATVLDEGRTLEERKEAVLQTLLAMGMSEDQARAQVSALFLPWYMTFLTLDPSDYLKGLTVPVLILNGTKDTQISAALHVPAIRKALLAGGNTRNTIKVYEGLNHLFQPAETGAPEEYGNIDITIDIKVLEDISKWIVSDRFQL